MAEARYVPPPKPDGKVVLELTEHEASLVTEVLAVMSMNQVAELIQGRSGTRTLKARAANSNNALLHVYHALNKVLPNQVSNAL